MLSFFLLSLLPALAEPAPSAPELAWAERERELLPAWEQRRSAAELARAGAQSFLDGEQPLELAFPHLRSAPLRDLSWVRARLAVLDQRALERASEARAPLGAPDVEARARASRARAAAFESEEQADLMERQLLLRLQSWLQESPQLSELSLEPWREALLGAIRSGTQSEDDSISPAALRAQQELQRLDRLIADRLTQILRGDLSQTLDLRPDLDASMGGSPQATMRLWLLLPELPPPMRAGLEEAEEAWLTEQLQTLAETAPPAGETETDPPAGKTESAETETESAETESVSPSAKTELALESSDPEVLRREVAVLEQMTALLDRLSPRSEEERGAADQRSAGVERKRRAWIQQRQASLQLALDALSPERLPDAVSEEATRAREEAAAAAQEAEEAQQQAINARARLEAQLLESVAEMKEEASALWTALEEEERAGAERMEAFLQTQSSLVQEREEILARSALAVGRQAELDTLYRRHRALMSQVREASAQVTEAQISQQSRGVTIQTSVLQERERLSTVLQEQEVNLSSWEEAAEDWISAASEGSQQLSERRDALLGLLTELRQERRELQPQISKAVRAEEQGLILQDLQHEIAFLSPWAKALFKHRLDSYRSLPQRLGDWVWLRQFLLGSFWLVLTVLGWRWMRPRATLAFSWLLQLSQLRRPARERLREEEHAAVTEQAQPMNRALVDLLFGYLLAGPIGFNAPEIGLLLLVYLQFATYRLLMGLFQVLTTCSEQPHPAPLVMRTALRDRTRLTLQIFIGWGILSQFMSFILLEFLAVDVLHEVTQGGLRGLLLILTLWLAASWEPALRTQVLPNISLYPRLALWLLAPSRSVLVRSLKGVCGTAALVVSSSWVFLDLRAGERSALGRLLNWMNRRGLKQEEREGGVVPEALQAVLRSSDERHQTELRRDFLEAFERSRERWLQRSHQGQMLICGDRGEGRRSYLRALRERLSEEGAEVYQAQLEQRLITERQVLDFLARFLELPDSEPPELSRLLQHLRELPPRILILDRLERAFLRAVGGFQALETLLTFVQRSPNKHLWILSVHRPAWNYLQRLGALFDVKIFREQLEISPLSEAELQELLEKRVQQAGFTLDFTEELTAPFNAAELQRRSRSFYRLLADVSMGNPAVAMTLCSHSLVLGEQPGSVHPYLDRHWSDRLPQLNDPQLFVLSALYIQDQLSQEELVEVTNLPPNAIGIISRTLRDRGLLELRGDWLQIPIEQVPRVIRMLRQRHFLWEE